MTKETVIARGRVEGLVGEGVITHERLFVGEDYIETVIGKLKDVAYGKTIEIVIREVSDYKR